MMGSPEGVVVRLDETDESRGFIWLIQAKHQGLSEKPPSFQIHFPLIIKDYLVAESDTLQAPATSLFLHFIFPFSPFFLPLAKIISQNRRKIC